MNPSERERLEGLLLEHAFGCAEDPAAVERLLAERADVRALQREVLAEKALLDRAARDEGEAVAVTFTPPEAVHVLRPARAPRWWTQLSRVAALLIVGLGIGLPWGRAYLGQRAADQASDRVCRLVVSGPGGLPQGARGKLRVETWDEGGAPLEAEVAWRALDAEGNALASGAMPSEGALDLALDELVTVTPPAPAAGRRFGARSGGSAPTRERAQEEIQEEIQEAGTAPAPEPDQAAGGPAAAGVVARIEVTARHEGEEVRCSLDVEPDREAPLVHLTTDRPVYRPGETAYLRAVLLDRLSLANKDGWCNARIVDPKGTPVMTRSLELEDGVASAVWQVAGDAAGGEYVFELRDAQNEFVVESLRLLVQRYQPPQLVKDITLDRDTYAPGAAGHAELAVTRVTGGPAAGAAVDARLLLDGESVWSARAALDERGRAVLSFDVPERVDFGDATLIARIIDGGVVETAVEPFVVPTGDLRVAFHPEGGDWIAGVPCRMYAEVTDPLGRPVDASGRVVDERGRTVAAFSTAHQGRGAVELTGQLGANYRLEFDAPKAAPVALPTPVAGVALRASVADRPDAPVDVTVHTPDEGPWIAAAFCRGVLVAQDTFRGAGEQRLSLEPDATVAGVLRVTVFDRTRRPVAERLVHRKSGRAIEVTLQALEDELLPGGHQRMELTAADETGAPVDAVLGVVVSDHALRDIALTDPVGIADATWLLSDVEDLEDLGEFVGDGPDVSRHVDLMLGTRGWRRFAWLDPESLLAEHGDVGRRLLVREGRSSVPRIDEDEVGRDGLQASLRGARNDRKLAATATSFSLLGLVVLGLTAALGLLPRLRPRPLVRLGGGVALAVLGLVVLAQPPAAGLVADSPFDAQAFNNVIGFGGALEGPPAPDEALPMELAFDVDLAGGEAWDAGRFDLAVVEQARELELQGGRFGARGPGALARGAPAATAAVGGGGGAEGPDAQAPAVDFLTEPTGEEVEVIEDLPVAQPTSPGPAQRRAWGRVYAHRHRRGSDGVRSDFEETVYWNALLRTGPDGTAKFEFDLSDRVTTWDVRVDAHGAGRVGQALQAFEAVPPFAMEARLPVELTVGDRVELPVALAAADPATSDAAVAADVLGPVALAAEVRDRVPLTDGRGRLRVPLAATGEVGTVTLGLAGTADGWTDRVRTTFAVVPRGFPHRVARSGLVEDSVEFAIGMPDEYVPGSLSADLVLYPAPLTDLLQGLEGVLRMPTGCFEQASATNYPNVLAVAYMDAAGIAEPAVMARARDLMGSGYERLVGYETDEDGYEWFGGAPAHEALTAYGLVQFVDMARVHDVDPDMLERTRQYLLGRRTGRGGYERNPRSLCRFGSAPQPVTDAYVTYALCVAGTPPADIEGELDHLAARGLESADPYEVALAAGALHVAGRAQAAEAVRERLKTMQEPDGSLLGTTSSITSSRGDDLVVETTALALLAWLDDDRDEANAYRALEFLLTMRRDGGRFGSTQATVQALRALTAWARTHRRIANDGEVIVFVNDFEVARLNCEAGETEALVLDGLVEHLSPGENRVRIELTGGNRFPWSFDLAYHSEQPADAPDAPARVRTRLADEAVVEGQPVVLEVAVENATDEGLPMTLAVIGLPAGLDCPNAVLEAELAAGAFDLWERRGRELVLYWRDLAPAERVALDLELVARIPGSTTGPASRVYPYYAPDQVRWAAPLTVEVTAAR